MAVFDIAGDARRAFDVLRGGGTAVVPHTIGYAALGGSGPALRRIFDAKRRGASKRNAMVANLATQNDVQQCSPRAREIVCAIVRDYDLPLGCIAPYRPDHPMLANLDSETLDASTHEGTLAILLNAGRFACRTYVAEREIHASVVRLVRKSFAERHQVQSRGH